MGIRFIEHQDPSYKGRTKENASADATIAIACNFKSAGEILTKKLVLDQRKIYIPIDISESLTVNKEIVNHVNSLLKKAIGNNIIDNSISLNIAGNGIYTMRGKYSQQDLDLYVYRLLKAILNIGDVSFNLIRSGGQTGLDEAGAKAGERLGIETLVVCPKGWKYRDISGVDIQDEIKFKERFKL